MDLNVTFLYLSLGNLGNCHSCEFIENQLQQIIIIPLFPILYCFLREAQQLRIFEVDPIHQDNMKGEVVKLLFYIDRNIDTNVEISENGMKTIKKDHTEIITVYQSLDGTEATKDSEPVGRW